MVKGEYLAGTPLSILHVYRFYLPKFYLKQTNILLAI